MPDKNICSFIMREQPEAVLKYQEQSVQRGHRIVVWTITCIGDALQCHRPESLAAPGAAGRRVLFPPRCHPAPAPGIAPVAYMARTQQ